MVAAADALAGRLGPLGRGGAKSLTPVRLPDGRAAIRKQWPGQAAGERLRREETILRRLDGLPGVPRLLAGSDGTSLLLHDERGVPLKDLRLSQPELLVLDQESGVRFRHDRVQQAAYRTPDAGTRERSHLRLARNLAGGAQFGALAAEQYLAVAGRLTDPPSARW